MIIADAPPIQTRPCGSDYAVLMNRVRQVGLLRRRPAYYATMLAAGWAIFVLASVGN
jgi:hypothetical protein